MTPDTRKKLEQKLNEYGLSVLLTRDYDSILIQLARLAQFERLMITALENDPLELFEVVMAEVREQQEAPPNIPEALRPLEIEDIPIVLTAAHKHLHDQLGKPAAVDTHTVQAAVSAFVGILCRR